MGDLFFHIYCILLTVPSSRILRYLCLSDFKELFYFFLIVGSKLRTQSRLCTDNQVISSQKSETLCCSESSVFILLVIIWAFSRMWKPFSHLFSVCLSSLQDCFQVQVVIHFFPNPNPSFCCLFALGSFFVLPSPTSHHGFIDAKLTCSSSISFCYSQIDHIELKSCIK